MAFHIAASPEIPERDGERVRRHPAAPRERMTNCGRPLPGFARQIVADMWDAGLA